MKRMVYSGILLFWVVMAMLLVRRTTFRPAPPSPPPPPLTALATQPLSQNGEESWMGIYHQQVKIGYFHRRLLPTPTGYRWEEQSRMRLRVLETFQTVHTDVQATMDRQYALQSLQLYLQGSGTTFRVSGSVTSQDDGQAFQGQMTSGDTTTPLTFPLRAPLYLPGTTSMALRNLELQPGAEHRFAIFNPLSMRTDTVTITALGLETLHLHGHAVQTSKVAERFGGTTVHAWLDAEGKVVKEEATLGLVLLRETREQALGGGWQDSTPLDLVTSAAIPVAQALPNPRALTRLRLNVSGQNDPAMLAFPPRQQYNNAQVAIVTEDLRALTTYTLPHADPAFADDLAATPFVQSTHPRLLAQAQRILRGERDALQAVRLLLDWTYTTLGKEPTLGMPTALEALDSQKGDCNEHAVLFVALARAAGIPARVTAGVVYLEQAFYYHAWTEIWLGQWVSVDPVLHQFPADATHVKLVQGGPEAHIALLKVIGQIGLDVVEFH